MNKKGLLVVSAIAAAIFLVVVAPSKLPLQTSAQPMAERKLSAVPPEQKQKTSLEITQSRNGTPQQHDRSVIAQSLQGTEIDGGLRADNSGALVLNQDVRDFFDYFLSSADELGPQAAIMEIQRYIDEYLPQPAAAQAQELLQNYLAYKIYEQDLQSTPLSAVRSDADALVILRETFETMKAKRLELFGQSGNQALFGLEETYQELTLRTLELFSDESMDDQQRQLELANLEANLPDPLQASRAQDAIHRQQQQHIQKLNNSTLDDASYYQGLVESGVATGKADELLSYRQQQAQFDQHYQLYRQSLSKLDPQAENFYAQQSRLQNRFFLSPEEITQAKLRDLTASRRQSIEP